MTKVILVTGGTRGLGRALCGELSRRGQRVYGVARSWGAEDLGEAGRARLGWTAVKADVTDEAEVKAAVERVIGAEGRIDVLVNNAGVSHHGPVEDTPEEQARAVFEINYFAAVRLCRSVLPVMRKQGQGTIVMIGSAAGKIAVPFQAHYSASKFALSGFTESLRHELMPFGVKVLLIEPGDVATSIWRDSPSNLAPDSVYAPAIARFREVKALEMGEKPDSPDHVAREIADLIESNPSALRHPVSRGTPLLLLLRKLLPDCIFLPLVARHYRINK